MRSIAQSAVKELDSIERMPSSKAGNPRWRVWFKDGTSAPTSPNAAWSYEAESPRFFGGPTVVRFTSRGQVAWVEEVPK